MTTEQTIQTMMQEVDPYSVEVTRFAKGNYGWVVKVRGKDKWQLLDDLSDIEGRLNDKYCAANAAVKGV